ncbi:hypothetical protein [Kitasatospora sp. CB01950]|uniref:hypothetical protein n=1 Tax=Kitasatospora sp. CB01950 TaxID=1703930 RepID=UPI00093CC5C8|nr:hypothetical protein [Kitasatospora sp. CB01950]OKJ06824.1 hypothetical protein AMK19_23535 [Kitasatospora sp. CB01950]
MSTPTDPQPDPDESQPDPGPQPDVDPDGHTWLPQEYCVAEGMWAPPDPQHIDSAWPAWRLPEWFAGRTGMVQIPGRPGYPGLYQYVWDGWLPWQSRTDTIDPLVQWPDAVRATAGDMQAELWPPAPVEGPPAADAELVPLVALSDAGDADVPPLDPEDDNTAPSERN